MESKNSLTGRLKEAGVWDQASEFMDEVRRQARATGATRRQAGDLAWKALAERHPRPEPEPDQVGAARPSDADGVSRHVCEAAGNEVRRWQREFGIDLPETAFSELTGGIVAAFWAMGLMHELPGGPPEVAA
jgi:hypothetical protein